MSELPISGAYALKAFRAQDNRGALSKYYEAEFGKLFKFTPAEVVVSESRENAIRGLHYQSPDEQHKAVWCTKGEIFEVILDMRKNSPSFGKWHGMRLSAKNGDGIFVPEGVAHGFESLCPSALLYVISKSQNPECERGVRFDDPALGIGWHAGAKDAIVSDKDRRLPLFKDALKI